jgi:signal transduction histidine kinase
VGDTGKGIPEEVAQKMFTPFYTTKQSGTGLGLAICKQVVEAQGGRIEFKSVPDKGTLFTVILPMRLNLIEIDSKQISHLAV